MNNWHILYQILIDPFTITITTNSITSKSAKHQPVVVVEPVVAVVVVEPVVVVEENANVVEIILIDSNIWHKVALDLAVVM